MVMVEWRCVIFPSYTDHVDFPYFKRFTQNKKSALQKKDKTYIDSIPKEKNTLQKTAEGVWLSFVPKFIADEFDDEVVELFKIYLVNQTDKSYSFIYSQEFAGKPAFNLKNEIQPFRDFYLHDVAFQTLNDNPVFTIQFSLLPPDKSKAPYINTSVKLKPKTVFKNIEDLKEKNEPAIQVMLFKEYPAKQYEEQPYVAPSVLKAYKHYEASQAKQHLEAARSIIDLHIEKLSDNWKHLINFEILSLQLKEFEKWYHLALAHYLPSFIVIHGIGSGKLRDEIHDILKTKKEVKTFVNQYHPRFGYGATEIFFKY
jgi:hypothetical protein